MEAGSKNYFSYHNHTDYSLLDSCTKPEEYVELAKKYGMKALATSNHGKILNWTELYGLCKEAGLKYVHAVEIYVTEKLFPKVRDNYHTVLLARNEAGVKELNSLVSMSCDEKHFFYKNRISFEELCNISPNIIITSACLASPLRAISKDHPMFNKLINRYDYLEIQPHGMKEQVEYNRYLWELSKEYNKPLIAATDSHASSRYKSECRDMLMLSKMKPTTEERAREMIYPNYDEMDLTFKSYEELVKAFEKQGALPEEVYLEAIENTNVMCDMIEEIELDTSIKYPILYGSPEKDAEVLEETIKVKFLDKLEKGIIPMCQKQGFIEAMTEEVRVFKKLGMSAFILSMSELVSWCKDNGLAIGNARGSVGGSRVAYVTDIIDLNPETWHTVFSRFCNEDREEINR